MRIVWHLDWTAIFGGSLGSKWSVWYKLTPLMVALPDFCSAVPLDPPVYVS